MHELEVARTRRTIAENNTSVIEKTWQMLQYWLDMHMDINEELIRELKAAHWRITKLMTDDDNRRRPTKVLWGADGGS